MFDRFRLLCCKNYSKASANSAVSLLLALSKELLGEWTVKEICKHSEPLKEIFLLLDEMSRGKKTNDEERKAKWIENNVT